MRRSEVKSKVSNSQRPHQQNIKPITQQQQDDLLRWHTREQDDKDAKESKWLSVLLREKTKKLEEKEDRFKRLASLWEADSEHEKTSNDGVKQAAATEVDNILDKAELLVEAEKVLIEDWAEKADSEFLNNAFGEPEDEPDSYVLSEEAPVPAAAAAQDKERTPTKDEVEGPDLKDSENKDSGKASVDLKESEIEGSGKVTVGDFRQY